MDKEEAIRTLKTEKQYTCKAPGVYAFGYLPMMGFTRMDRYFNEFYTYEIVIYKDRQILQNESWDQAFRNCKFMYDNISHTLKVISDYEVMKKEYIRYLESLPEPSNLDDKKLVEMFFDLIDHAAEIWAPSLITDGIGVYTESELWEDFLKEVKSDDARKIFLELTHSPEQSFVGKEKRSFLNLVLMHINKHDYSRELSRHQKEFYWIQNSYREVKALDTDHFSRRVEDYGKTEKEIREELKAMDSETIRKKQEELFNKISISKELKDKLLLTQKLSTWQDKRKEIDLRSKHYQNRFLLEFAERMCLDKEEIYYTTPHEIRKFFENGSKPSKEQFAGRQKLFVHICTIPFSDVTYEGNDAEEILEAYESIGHEKEIKGTAVSFGKDHLIKGEVNIVIDPDKADFKKGQIMVTSMTRPEFVPLMHLAKAIVTDEGGVTTHAGIVSRELGIACIVGTRSATKVLKSGDMIELDTKTGEVRKRG